MFCHVFIDSQCIVKKLYETGRFQAESERVRELWMMKVVSEQSRQEGDAGEERSESELRGRETGVRLTKRNSK